MNIQINGEEIQFEMNEEKSLQQVVDSISEWSAERDLIFTDLILNEELINISDLEDKPLTETDVINCLIQSRADIIISSLTEGTAYCMRVLDYIDNSVETEKFDVKELEQFFKGVEWLRDMTLSVFQLLTLDPNGIKHLDKPVSEYLNDLHMVITDLSGISDEKAIITYLSSKMQLFEEFKGIFKLVLLSDNIKKMISKSLDSPDILLKLLHEIKRELPDQISNLEKVAEAYQTGKDESAIQLLQDFLDFIYSYTRLCYQISPVFSIDLKTVEVNGISLEDKNADIHSFLNEIIEVMENEDVISLADILEYEIKPLIENVDEYIDLLVARI
ncbi:MAG: hypothetical protein JW982_01195 [Spirochaetes bacterium]|nr:hypothetical protein [Spirochaetota bacterium]